MCREGAWAELAAEVTFMVGIQSRTPGKKYIQNIPDFYPILGKGQVFLISSVGMIYIYLLPNIFYIEPESEIIYNDT